MSCNIDRNKDQKSDNFVEELSDYAGEVTDSLSGSTSSALKDFARLTSKLDIVIALAICLVI